MLRDKLKDVPGLKSNQDEHLVLIAILACAGVLTPKFYHRPTSGKHDWKFAEYWRREDGYCTEVIENYPAALSYLQEILLSHWELP